VKRFFVKRRSRCGCFCEKFFIYRGNIASLVSRFALFSRFTKCLFSPASRSFHISRFAKCLFSPASRSFHVSRFTKYLFRLASRSFHVSRFTKRLSSRFTKCLFRPASRSFHVSRDVFSLSSLLVNLINTSSIVLVLKLVLSSFGVPMAAIFPSTIIDILLQYSASSR